MSEVVTFTKASKDVAEACEVPTQQLDGYAINKKQEVASVTSNLIYVKELDQFVYTLTGVLK